MADLTTEQMIQIVETHIQNIKYAQYNTQLSVLEEKAKTVPDQTNLDNLSAQVVNHNNQMNVLDQEMTKLQAALAKEQASIAESR